MEGVQTRFNEPGPALQACSWIHRQAFPMPGTGVQFRNSAAGTKLITSKRFRGWQETVPAFREAAFAFQEPDGFKKPRNRILHHFLCKMEVAEIKELIGRRPETLSNSPEKRLFSAQL
jgi:hypothetical protein